MTNFHFTNQITNHKNEILNFLSEESKTFRFSFLNNKQNTSNKCKSPLRKDMAGCHCYFLPWEATGNGWLEYKQDKAYYISFNEWVDGGLSKMTIRTEYIEYFGGEDISNKYFLFISKMNDSIYEIPFKDVLFVLKDLKRFHNNAYECVHIPVDELAIRCSKMNHNTYVQSCTKSYDPAYFEPKFIGNFAYAHYISGTNVNIFKVSTTGAIENKRTFRSMKECYDMLKKANVEGLKTYKTFQRHCADGDMTFEYVDSTGTKQMLVVSLNEEINVEVERVIDETMPNPLFCEDCPEDVDNPKELVIKDHYNVSVKQNKVDVSNIIETEEICLPDYDDNKCTKDEEKFVKSAQSCSADRFNKVDVWDLLLYYNEVNVPEDNDEPIVEGENLF